MRKRIIQESPQDPTTPSDEWLDLEALAEVEVTSEDPNHPVEGALLPGHAGWRAASPGTQTLRILFDTPQSLRRIYLQFAETNGERTQEFSLRYAASQGERLRDIVRQQWTFSPGGSTQEQEDYQVELPKVAVLELTLTPDTRGGDARASLDALRLA